jgi:hypothetical protein
MTARIQYVGDRPPETFEHVIIYENGWLEATDSANSQSADYVFLPPHRIEEIQDDGSSVVVGSNS